MQVLAGCAHKWQLTPAAFCCTGIQGTESSVVDSEASIAENRLLPAGTGYEKEF